MGLDPVAGPVPHRERKRRHIASSGGCGVAVAPEHMPNRLPERYARKNVRIYGRTMADRHDIIFDSGDHSK